jgi:hypothetical protein
MAESDEEILGAAKNFIDRFDANAFSEAKKMERDAVLQRDAEAITYWRKLIEAFSRTQP